MLGLAGLAATVGAFVFAGVVFGLVVSVGAGLAVLGERRRRTRQAAAVDPVDIAIGSRPPEHRQ
jgi:hypothetical protein